MAISVPLKNNVHALMETKVHVSVEGKVCTLKWNITGTDPVLPSRSHQCLYCSRNHALEDCNALRWKPYAERIQFLASNKLCFGCLSDQHVSTFCPQRKACKITNFTRKHPSILHTNFRERLTTDVGVEPESRSDTQVRSRIVNASTNAKSQTVDERCRTGMAVLPVKVRARNSDKSVITYPFLDNGNSAFFINHLLRTHNIYNLQFTKLVITLTNNSNNKKLTENLQIDTKILTSQCFYC